MDIQSYIRDERHIPDFIKDFHDAKDFFKLLYEWQCGGEKIRELECHTWVSQHIYTMDIFLRFCALFGYRLEKIRSPKMDVCDLSKSIADYNDRISRNFAAALGLGGAPQKSEETSAQTHNSSTTQAGN